MKYTVAEYKYLSDKANKVIKEYLSTGEVKETLIARFVSNGKTMDMDGLRQFSKYLCNATVNTVLGSDIGLDFILLGEDFTIYTLSSQIISPDKISTRLSIIESLED